jgi:RND superfamily putative drug exporter
MMRLLGALAASRRANWVTVAAWVALAAGLGPLVLQLPDVTTNETTGFLPASSQSRELARVAHDRFPGGEIHTALIVYRRAGGLSGGDRAAITAQARAAARVPHVGQPIAPGELGAPPGLVSRRGDVAFTVVPILAAGQKPVKTVIDALRASASRSPAGLAAEVTGPAAVDTDLNSAFGSQDGLLLAVTGLLVLGLLMLIYRSPAIAMVPLVVVGTAYAVTAGVVYLLAKQGLKVSSTSTSLLLVLMFGAGTDYCLLLAARYTEDLRGTADHRVALSQAVTRAGPAILASGFTVIAALLSLLVADVGSTRSLGPVTALGVAVVMLAGLTLLPALLALLGRRAFWPSTKLVAHSSENASAQRAMPQLLPGLGRLPNLSGAPLSDRHPTVRLRDGIWRRLGLRVIAHPVRAILAVVCLLLVGALGFSVYHPQADILQVFRNGNGSTRGAELLRSGFPPGTLAPNDVLVDRRGGPLTAADVAAAQARVRVNGVSLVTPVSRRSRDGRAAIFQFVFADDPYRNPALGRVATIRKRLASTGTGLRAIVGGGSAVQLDYREAANRDLFVIVPVVLAVILLTLIVLLRALVAPLYLIASVILSYFGILGISLAFWHFIAGETAFDASVPTFAFIFLVALGVDYNIFLMDRVREEAALHGTREGLLRALVATGPVITSAGIILAGTFATLVLLPITILAEVGLTVALGVLIDTFLVRTVLVPAITSLLGERSWWPSRVQGADRREPPAVPALATRGPTPPG